ncbi:MAG: putative photosynthetic complex assembly protein PuhE [Myxococcota bacterium]
MFASLVPAALFALFTWWFSTGVILLMVDRLPRRWHRLSVVAVGLLALAALGLVYALSEVRSVWSAYVGYGAALMIWAFHELSFLTGVITGPRRSPCPPKLEGTRRFWCATEVVIFHELALFVTWLLLAASTWGSPNQIGVLTFTVLWIMRLSAKFNLFLGVQNITVEFIPSHLSYMQTYFRRSGTNLLMPFSVAGCVLGVFWLATQAATAEPMQAAGLSLAATLLALAGLEHIFLAFKLPDAVLWRWALRR